jgi:hypothetical protein
MGRWTGIPTRWIAVAIALALGVMAVPVVAPAQAASGVAQSIPAHYINNYPRRAQKCRDLVTPPWVKWLSYANAYVSDEWVVATSSKQLCPLARNTSDAAITDAPNNDGALQNLSDMIAYARNHPKPSTRRAPKPAGASWKCQLLPSYWGDVARDLQPGNPTNEALAGASGAAAGAGFCEKGATQTNGKYKGGQFFSWAPDTLTCRVHYGLKTIPDPNNPGETTNPPFPANLWGDYDRLPC